MTAPALAQRGELIALMFHEVTDRPEASGFQRPSAIPYKHTLNQFRACLDEIMRSGTAPARINAMDGGARHLLLTFDDGGASAMTAADMLEQRGWRGHFFVVTSFVDQPCFVTRANVRDLHARGHLVGSHSHTHPDVFRNLSTAQMAVEWDRSRAVLEDVLGQPVDIASIPGGHGDHRTERAAAAAGYRVLFTSEPTTAVRSTDGMLCVGRVCLKAAAPPARAGALARGHGFARERWLWRGKNAVRSALAMPRRLLARGATQR